VTLAGIAAVSVISGQEQARRQDTSLVKSARSAQTPPLGSHDPAAVPDDVVTVHQAEDAAVYSRPPQPYNLAVITAYQSLEPVSRRQAMLAISAKGGEEAAPEVPTEVLTQEGVDVTG
jgi:hypothetical protein